ncbi:FtsH protease activity modulator HflK [Reinekea sp. G2M2-21]|uniref:FtsH protease activity modulator HflK n=1 Tax=Reinekea sp. G2M2-21 TaxID=2788942 RepID=UPI0018A913C6|nr:FtsH protease activity modulator HflK [Reinekea sp. G2M2-21]MDX1341294.1 FtsH protease activity modulator HflK [Reinekea sp.]MDX1473244.1 FtsH protease activity modulator HflK [Reinekea sp.]
MAWNEPPGGNNDQDPWGNRNRNKGNDGPPDLDDLFKQLNTKLNKWLGGGGNKGGNNNSSGSGGGFASLLALVIVAGVLYVAYDSFYTVDESERAVVLRLGKFYSVENPGLQMKIPFIDRIADKVNVTQVREHSLKNSMLTADENIVEVSMTVEYRAADAKAYVLNVRDPQSTIAHAAESALRHVVGSARLEQILTVGRDQVQALVKERLQTYLDNYDVGIQLAQLKITDAAPPSAVQDAFDDVIKAREDQQRLVNEAQAYANQIVPVAQGQAQRQLAEAEAYRQEVVAKATGESDRFSALLAEYEKAPDITRQRLYLNTIEEIYAKSSKVLLDVENGNNMMYLPLDQLRKNSTASAISDLTTGAANVNNLTQSEVSNLTDQILREIDRRRNNQ